MYRGNFSYADVTAMSRGERTALIKQIVEWMKEEADAAKQGRGGGGGRTLSPGSMGTARFKRGF